MIKATGITGTADECHKQFAAFRNLSVDIPIIRLFARGPGAKAKFETVIYACAP